MHGHTFFCHRTSDIDQLLVIHDFLKDTDLSCIPLLLSERVVKEELLGHNASSTMAYSYYRLLRLPLLAFMAPGLKVSTGVLPNFCSDYTVSASQDLTTS